MKIIIALSILAIAIGGLLIALPSILHKAGLHPNYAGEDIQLPGKKALIITTSHSVLSKVGETTGKKTGVFASEMTIPYYRFLDAGMSVDVASVKGGKIPVDPQSFLYMVKTPQDDRYLQDDVFRAKVKNSLHIDNVDFTQYDAIFIAGGWGAAYDLGASVVLGQKVSEAYYAKSPIFGSVCHGALGFIQAKDKIGELLSKGRRMSGVTDKQIKELRITYTPYHPETELKKAGVIFESNTKFRDFLATHVAIDDEQRFVTGQNQNSGQETAHKMMELIAQQELKINIPNKQLNNELTGAVHE